MADFRNCQPVNHVSCPTHTKTFQLVARLLVSLKNCLIASFSFFYRTCLQVLSLGSRKQNKAKQNKNLVFCKKISTEFTVHKPLKLLFSDGELFFIVWLTHRVLLGLLEGQ